MSASREKKNRQELSGDPKTAREAQLRKEEHRSNVLYGIIAAAFVVAAVVAIVWKSNILQKTATAAVVDGQKYNAAEVGFYYQNVYRTFYNQYYYYLMAGVLSLDPQSDLAGQAVTESDISFLGLEATDVGRSWKDVFLDQALDQIATVQTALKAAQDEGFVYPDSVQADHEASMDSLRSAAAASGRSTTQYLQASMGTTMTEKIYGEHLLRMLQYSAYGKAYQDSLVYSDGELEKAYGEDRDTYDKAAYEYVLVSGSAPGSTDADGNAVEPTEEESAAAMAEAKEIAGAILARWKANDGKLESLAESFASATYTNVDSGSYTGDTVTSWVFDEARKSGDAEVVESGSSYYVIVFHDRSRETYDTVAVRHILVRADDSALDTTSDTYESDLQAVKDSAKAKAEELLAQWKAGDATEDSFAALAAEQSEDGGSKSEGGLYSRFPKGQMVAEFNDWCFDPARKTGDTGIVYGESSSYKGYHVMYFVDKDLPYWKVQVTNDLQSAALMEWEDNFGKDHTIEWGSGMKYVG